MMESITIRRPFIREIANTIAGTPRIAGQYRGAAYLYKRRDARRHGGKTIYRFMLIARNGEKIIQNSHPYNRKGTMLTTLKKFFPEFVIIDKTNE